MTYNPEYLDIIPIDVDTLPEAADTINLNFQNIAASINGVVSGVVAPFSYSLSHKTGGNPGCLDALTDMVDGETAIVLEGDRVLFYYLDSSSGVAADGVYVIEPVVSPGTKRWKLSGQPLKLWQLDRVPGIADDYTSGVMVADFCVYDGVLYVCASNAYNNATWAVVPSLGTTAGTACEGNDSRLSNDRPPTAHASTHVDTDPIPLATASSKGLASAAQITKLNGIESNADVTDAQNVAAAGAVMDGDFSANGIMCRDGLGIYSVKVIGTGSGQIASGNDSRFPSSSEKEALAGTSGTPSGTNKYVTDQDSRMTDERNPTLHGAAKHTGIIGTESQITFDPVGGHNHDGTGSRKIDHASLLNIGSNTHAQIDSHIAAASPHSGHLTLGGQLGNTVSSPDVRGIRETSGPTLLTMGAVADRGLLSRSGTTVVSVPVPDVIGGQLVANSTTLVYASLLNGYVTLWDGSGYVTVPHGTPSLANTGTDMNGTTLAYDVNYDVFIRYESATSTSIKLAKWASHAEGTSARFAAWVTSTAYVIGHRVTQSGSYYSCIQAHTSGASTQPGSGASWADYWVVQTQSADTAVPGLHFTGTYLSYCGNATGATAFDGRKYRWVGVVRLRNNASVPNFADDDTYRYIANAFNMTPKYVKCSNGTGTWTYSVATTTRESNGGTGQVRGYCVIARAQTVPYRFAQIVSTSSTSYGVYVAPVFNQVTSQSGYCVGFTTWTGITPIVVVAYASLAYGYNWFSTTEYLSGAITGNFWGGGSFSAVARLLQ